LHMILQYLFIIYLKISKLRVRFKSFYKVGQSTFFLFNLIIL
jgi:hypothetical protein